MKSQTNQNRFN